MKRRFPVAAALLVAVGVAACSSPPAALGTREAKVIINGEATNALQPVTCHQTGQSWTIETLDKEPGFGDDPTGCHRHPSGGRNPQPRQFHRHLLE